MTTQPEQMRQADTTLEIRALLDSTRFYLFVNVWSGLMCYAAVHSLIARLPHSAAALHIVDTLSHLSH